MDLGDLIGFEAVLPGLRAGNKRQVLQELAARAARVTGLDERHLFDKLVQRERMGATAVGHGVAIPHVVVEGLDRSVCLFARLERAIDFETIDGQPVDLIVVLLSPVGSGADHLKALARIARVMRNATLTARLRASRDPHALYALLAHSVEPDAA
jgi:PTS system nitrogen regulatory IIA component